jgi:serine protease AprX
MQWRGTVPSLTAFPWSAAVPAIPDFVVEFFLLGRTRREAIERYTQDGGIVTDVWLAFAKDLQAHRRVLVASTKGTSAVDVGFALHKTITAYRAELPTPSRGKPGVSPLENFVAVTLYFDELLRVILPMTNWWHDKNLSALRRKAARSGPTLDDALEQAIRNKLGREENEVGLRQEFVDSADAYPDRRVIQAASLAALIGVFLAAQENPTFLGGLQGIDPRIPEGEDRFVAWVNTQAETIASAARRELARPFVSALLTLPADMPGSRPHGTMQDEPPVLVQRVFLDRDATLADTSANCTIKADAAYRVFDISCRDVTWAIIDSGIATTHPAFEDHDAKDPRGQPILPRPQRIKATYDFTRIEQIRNFDLISEPEGSLARRAAIEAVVNELEQLPGRAVPPNFHQDAIRQLESIARQLEQRIPPDWGLIEPLIRWGDNDNGVHLVSDHGTHVAGILAGDWRSPKQGLVLPCQIRS